MDSPLEKTIGNTLLMKHAPFLVGAINAALNAGQAILEVYQSDFAVENKADYSPITKADTRSNEIIAAGLVDFGIPFISEEGKNTPFEVRKGWDTLWVVDPLDGTKEFVKRNGEFTVNIALVERQQPIIGVVYAPTLQWLYFASTEIGAFKLSHVQAGTFKLGNDLTPEEQLHALTQNSAELPMDHARKAYTIVGSRSHGSPELEDFVKTKKREQGDVEFTVAGSSLKICLVADGTADIYPRLGPTMEWDTAAGQAIAECAGARLYAYHNGRKVKYNKKNLLNPWFVVER